MSKILSIYNEWAFCEVVLPVEANTEYSFLLDAELFHLQNNERIQLESVWGSWRFAQSEKSCQIHTIDPDTPAEEPLADRARYGIRTLNGEQLTVLTEERREPFQSYEKYPLSSGSVIHIGLEADNEVLYHYSCAAVDTSFVSRHHCTLRCTGSEILLEDTSSNGTYVNNIRVNKSQKLNYGDSIRIFGLNIVCLGNLIAMNHPPEMETKLAQIQPKDQEAFEQPGDPAGSSRKTLFFRAPRTVPKVNLEPVTIDPPPAPTEQRKMPLMMQIGPALTMTIPMILGSGLTVMASQVEGSGSSMMMYTGLITAVASAFIGVFWALMNIRYQRKTAQEAEKRRFEKYGRYLLQKQQHVEELYQAASKALREKYLPAERIVEYTAQSELLWNRNFNHSDVLTYRLGLGSRPLPIPIEVPKEKFTMIDDVMEEKPRLIRDRFKTMRDVPVCIDLKVKSLVGVVGQTSGWAPIIKDLVVQIAGNNSYTDVKIAFVYDADKVPSAKMWEFVKWLPHTWSEDKRIRFYATGKKEASEVFYELGQILRTRSEDKHCGTRPYYVLFVLNKELLEGELLSKYISDTSSELGFSTILAAERYEELPNRCEFLLENSSRFHGGYSTIDENAEEIPIEFDRLQDEQLMGFAKRLANIQVNESESGGEIPSAVSFFEMYGIAHPEQLQAQDRWRKANTAQTMKALVGLKSGGKECYLDIHEKYHGPHGLVAGTTGSGKSETLQTYMLSLAINYSPDDVGFFIIDYKGGGMANLFEGLPHIIGAVSNLSGNQVRRAMVSIKSENKRRQRAFSNYGVNNINSYTALYKSGDAKEPIPHMFIIIDEFAELKREEPDFMQELVSVAQVGRSLGVHLILATQKPAGTVDDNIWSNSKFRLCLRVQDRQDSMDMLHRPDAAYLTQAGRTYLQVGNDEIFELFQSGYSGAAYDKDQGSAKLILAQMLDSVGKVDLAGNHQKIKQQAQAQAKWVKLLYQAVHTVLQTADQSRLLEEGHLDEAALERLYEAISQQGADFKRSQYNDVRLQGFARLVCRMEPIDPENRAEKLLEAAAKEKVRLPEMKSKTQLEAVNEYLAQVAVQNGYDHTFTLWMPVLPSQILLRGIEGYQVRELEARCQQSGEREWSLAAIIGKGDDPENQDQMPISIDFGQNGHHAVCGMVATGKSTLVQTALYSLISKYSPEELNIYVLDFSAKMLTVFQNAAQVGGVMTDAEEDEEKIAKFFTMLAQILAQRKKLLAGTSYQDYVQHSGQSLPAILLVIDNYAAFRDKTAEQYEETVRRLAKEGLSYGVYLFITGGGFGSGEISSALADSIRTCICLEMADSYQYSDVMRVARVPVMPESNVKGRGLVEYGDRIIEFQTAMACDGSSALERNEQIGQDIQKLNALCGDKTARRVPVIPEKPLWDEFVKTAEYTAMIADPRLLPHGYDSGTAEVAALELPQLLTCAVSGTRRSGKTVYMKNLICACRQKDFDVCVIEIGGGEYESIAQQQGCRYVTDGQELFDYVEAELYGEVQNRSAAKKQGLEDNLDEEEFFRHMQSYRSKCTFIANAARFTEELYNPQSPANEASEVLELLTGEKGRHYNFYFFAEIGDAEISEVLGWTVMQNFQDNGVAIRFGGRYLSQNMFSYANVPYNLQESATKTGTGVMSSEEDTCVRKQVVVPNNRG